LWATISSVGLASAHLAFPCPGILTICYLTYLHVFRRQSAVQAKNLDEAVDRNQSADSRQGEEYRKQRCVISD